MWKVTDGPSAIFYGLLIGISLILAFTNKLGIRSAHIVQRNCHAQQYLARKNLQYLVILDLLAGQISCSAELSMKNVL